MYKACPIHIFHCFFFCTFKYQGSTTNSNRMPIEWHSIGISQPLELSHKWFYEGMLFQLSYFCFCFCRNYIRGRISSHQGGKSYLWCHHCHRCNHHCFRQCLVPPDFGKNGRQFCINTNLRESGIHGSSSARHCGCSTICYRQIQHRPECRLLTVKGWGERDQLIFVIHDTLPAPIGWISDLPFHPHPPFWSSLELVIFG